MESSSFKRALRENRVWLWVLGVGLLLFLLADFLFPLDVLRNY